MRLRFNGYGDMLRQVEAAAGDLAKLDGVKYQLETEKADLEEYIWRLEQSIEECDRFIADLDENVNP